MAGEHRATVQLMARRADASRHTSVTTSGELIWHCEVCGGQIWGASGYIFVDWVAALRRHEGRTAGENGGFVELLDPIPWHVTHRRCDPNPAHDDYWWSIDRCQTLADVLDWWLHLSGKTWLGETDWERFIRRHVLPQGEHRTADPMDPYPGTSTPRSRGV